MMSKKNLNAKSKEYRKELYLVKISYSQYQRKWEDNIRRISRQIPDHFGKILIDISAVEVKIQRMT